MLTEDENKTLTTVDAGSPVGDLFRSVWLPALLSAQLPAPGCPPVRLKLLGEELVGFRDGSGKVGIVQAHCAHRLAPLFFGKVEQRGLRCSYHGWLYDTGGQCLEIPSDPENASLCRKMTLKAYAVAEKADIVWIYMGAGEPPALPKFPWIDLPKARRVASVWLQETNWFQGVEGEIDSSHVSILHRSNSQKAAATKVHQKYTFLDPSPKLYARDTPIGFQSVARRKADDRYYWRVTQWMAPMFSFIPSAIWPVGGRAWVPMDNENTYTWDFAFSEDDIPEEYYESMREGRVFPPETEYRSYRLNTGAIVDTWVPKRTAANNYLVDRKQQAGDFESTGIWGINDQDRAMQEGMGRITRRHEEKLVAADLTVVTARRKILGIVKSKESLERFRRLIADGTAYSMSPIDAVADTDDIETFLMERSVA